MPLHPSITPHNTPESATIDIIDCMSIIQDQLKDNRPLLIPTVIAARYYIVRYIATIMIQRSKFTSMNTLIVQVPVQVYI